MNAMLLSDFTYWSREERDFRRDTVLIRLRATPRRCELITILAYMYRIRFTYRRPWHEEKILLNR